jgi:predicted O-methyltransferase YrrM
VDTAKIGTREMKRKSIANAIVPVIDFALVVLVVPAAILLKIVRRLGLSRLKVTRSALIRIGVLPIRNHYYEPYVDPRELKLPLDEERKLPGIDLNTRGQLEFLATLSFEAELGDLMSPRSSVTEFRLGNQSFESGDAEYLYQLIRRLKPARLYEIGSGHSTLIARQAIARNCSDDASYRCRHVCIEPFEAPWLESTGVEVLRRRVEEVDVKFFGELEGNDLLFIDSSHVIRPQGDVLTEYLGILPTLRSGVVVHIHDVFTPRDYLKEWVIDSLQLWNEQYLMEAFLCNNSEWTIIGALNFLKHSHFEALRRVCPYLTADREPGSFYIRKD